MTEERVPSVAGRVGLWRFDTPLDPDDIPYFHSARLLILLRVATRDRAGGVRGRTKLAKLDFFVRYPHFLETALAVLRARGSTDLEYRAGDEGVEASMVRYRFGPWDHRYYDLLGMLASRELVRISGSVESYSLTPDGRALADQLMAEPAFADIVMRSELVSSALGGFDGSALKTFVYETFTDEVTRLPSGRQIADRARPTE